jgi:hypothetical protein
MPEVIHGRPSDYSWWIGRGLPATRCSSCSIRTEGVVVYVRRTPLRLLCERCAEPEVKAAFPIGRLRRAKQHEDQLPTALNGQVRAE